MIKIRMADEPVSKMVVNAAEELTGCNGGLQLGGGAGRGGGGSLDLKVVCRLV